MTRAIRTPCDIWICLHWRKKRARLRIVYNTEAVGNIEMYSKELPDRKPPITLGKGEWAAIRLAQEMGEGAVLATDDGKAIKTCRFLNLPFIISPKIATELYRHGRIERPLAKAAIEKMRIEGRYPPDIIAEALLRLEEIGNVETGNREDT